MSIVSNHTENLDKAIDHYINGIATLKTGRANPAILDSVTVEVYGTKTPLTQVASISVPEARSIVIKPWDKNVTNDIDKAIRDANLGFSPVNEGDKIRISIPQMTEESRKDIVKMLHGKSEESRIAIRNIRDDIKEEILDAEKNKEFGEDEKFSLMEELDKTVGQYNEKVKEIGDKKEQEIMTV